MFERYINATRNAIFWARYRAEEAGSSSIEPEHLLAGILDGNPTLVERYPQLAEIAPPRIAQPPRPAALEPVPHRDVPLSQASKRALAYSAEESERLKHSHVGPEHLLLGLLREGTSNAAELLRAHGVTLEGARKNFSREGARESQ